MSEAQATGALLLLKDLHTHYMHADIITSFSSMKSVMRKADKMDARYCLIIGEDEQSQSRVMIKDMKQGTSDVIPQVQVIEYIQDSMK
jgi:histidyl-tRNA synthetase